MSWPFLVDGIYLGVSFMTVYPDVKHGVFSFQVWRPLQPPSHWSLTPFSCYLTPAPNADSGSGVSPSTANSASLWTVRRRIEVGLGSFLGKPPHCFENGIVAGQMYLPVGGSHFGDEGDGR